MLKHGHITGAGRNDPGIGSKSVSWPSNQDQVNSRPPEKEYTKGDMTLRYQIIDHAEGFRELQDEWNALLVRSRSNTIFLTWEWQFTWWKSYGGELYIIAVYDQERLVALFPFVRKVRGFFYCLSFIGAPHSDYLDIIVEEGCEEKIIRHFFNDFLAEHRKIGVIGLDSVNERSPHFHTLAEVIDGSGFSVKSTAEKACPYLVLPRSWDIFLHNLSRQTRYLVNRKQKKILGDFSVNIGVVEQLEDLQTRMDHFIDQHQKRWTGIQRPGAFIDSSFRDFHKKISEILFNKGLLRFYFLELDTRPVASYYIFFYNNSYQYYLSGFDPEYAKYSPGVVLMARAIQDAIEAGLQEFDMMRGEGAYKFRWTGNIRTNRSFVIARKCFQVSLYLFGQARLRSLAQNIKNRLPPETKNKIRDFLPQRVVSFIDSYFRR